MSLHEIVLPETKPETEWVGGRALQKVSPTYDHGGLQAALGAGLREWAKRGRRGRVATEWRFRITPPGGLTRPLVPDVAFLSYEALPVTAPRDAVQVPLAAPTVAVEILSPDDRRADLEDKIATYRAAGSAAVIVVDPQRRTVAVHDDDGIRVLKSGDTLVLRALPGFALGVNALFAELDE
jgi:Uma2 family endonuclease